MERIILLPDAEDDRRIAEELEAWRQAQMDWLGRGRPSGLQHAGLCPRCDAVLKYVAWYMHSSTRRGFIVWCDKVHCLVVSDTLEEA